MQKINFKIPGMVGGILSFLIDGVLAQLCSEASVIPICQLLILLVFSENTTIFFLMNTMKEAKNCNKNQSQGKQSREGRKSK